MESHETVSSDHRSVDPAFERLLGEVHDRRDALFRAARHRRAEQILVAPAGGTGVRLVVDFTDRASLLDLLGLQHDAGEILGCPVDVFSSRSICGSQLLAQAVAL